MPYNPNPPPLTSGTRRSQQQAQEDRYSFLARVLARMTPKRLQPVFNQQTIYNRLRLERLLPAYPKPPTAQTLKRLTRFAKNVLDIKGFKISQEGLETVLEGGSP